MKRIAVFCGARAGRNDAYLPIAAQAGREIARAGFGVVYGGGRVGMMGALADAALAEGAEVIGVIPESLATAEIAHRGVTKLHVVGSMHERKALMAGLADAFIALPGGIGTMDEFCEMLTWRQLGIHDKPVGLLNHDGFYDKLLELFDQMLDAELLLPPTRALLADAPTIAGLLEAFSR
ncbi:MAG TPA: TIGR00730 family Rossman fold protein [Candidatus Baltobacteraceae bacterium]